MFLAGLIVALVLLDQITKHLVWSSFCLGEVRPVIPGLFNLRYVRNDGAAWGLFSGHRWPLITVSVVMLALICRHRRDIIALGRSGFWAVGLLAGGITGNLIDRLRFGYVVDFADFFWKTQHFPAFNVADSAICIGVAFYVWATLAAHGTRTEDFAAPGSAEDTPAS